MTCPSFTDIVRSCDEGGLSPSSPDIVQHIQQCTPCREQIADLSATLEALRHQKVVEASDERRRRILNAIAEEKKPRRPIVLWSGAFASALAVCAFWLIIPATSEDPLEDGFQARAHDHSQWSGMHIYRLPQEGATPELITEVFTESDRLLFAYGNQDPRRFSWLAIVAVDAQENFLWYHPQEPTSPGDTTALPIEHGVTGREIPVSVRLGVPAGDLHIFAVFSRRPLSQGVLENEVHRYLRDPQSWAREDMEILHRHLRVEGIGEP